MGKWGVGEICGGRRDCDWGATCGGLDRGEKSCVGGLGGAAFDTWAMRMGSLARREDEERGFQRVARTKRPLHPWLPPCAPPGRRWIGGEVRGWEGSGSVVEWTVAHS